MPNRALLSLLLLVSVSLGVRAQEHVFSGSLESNSLLEQGGAFHSNNYLKLDYSYGRLSAGLQAEYYPSPLPGYDARLKGIGLPGKYIAWTDSQFSATAGDFYDQFGTGIIFRSWEDRNLGWNNSLGGGRVSFRTRDDVFSLKALGGWKRQFLGYSSQALGGADALLQLGPLSLEGSAVARMGDGSTEMWWQALGAYSAGGFSARAEYVGKKGGDAETLELGYGAGKFSSTLTLRRLSRMQDPFGLNYLPSLCMEQSYSLAALNPYTTFADGELGGSADVYYSVKSWKFHVNGCWIMALPSALHNYDVLRLAYRDINIQVEKRWGRRLKTVAFVSIQENSPSHGDRKATNAQNVFVLDGLYRFPGKLSLRAQFQYLYSEELTKDWMAGSLELSSTDGWSVHVQDLYNHGDSREHYYEAGVSWTRGGFKADLAYGHQRSGMVCSGGVCRWQPEYQGGLLRLAYHF